MAEDLNMESLVTPEVAKNTSGGYERFAGRCTASTRRH